MDMGRRWLTMELAGERERTCPREKKMVFFGEEKVTVRDREKKVEKQDGYGL
jgi:hypothetical protein